MSGELDTLFKLSQLSEMIKTGKRQDEQLEFEREKYKSSIIQDVARQSQANSFVEIDKLLDKNGISGLTDKDLSSRESFYNFTKKIKDPLLKNLLSDRYDNITKQNYILGKDSYTQEIDNNYKRSATANQYSNVSDLNYKRLAYDKDQLLNKQFGLIADKINKQKIIIPGVEDVNGVKTKSKLLTFNTLDFSNPTEFDAKVALLPDGKDKDNITKLFNDIDLNSKTLNGASFRMQHSKEQNVLEDNKLNRKKELDDLKIKEKKLRFDEEQKKQNDLVASYLNGKNPTVMSTIVRGSYSNVKNILKNISEEDKASLRNVLSNKDSDINNVINLVPKDIKNSKDLENLKALIRGHRKTVGSKIFGFQQEYLDYLLKMLDNEDYKD